MTKAPYLLEFFEADNGTQPCRKFIDKELTVTQRSALVVALDEVLAFEGQNVCATPFGKLLGGGLFEFRLDLDAEAIRSLRSSNKTGAGSGKTHESILLRVFCHAYGEKIVLLLSGYDKKADPKAQNREIEAAHKLLGQFKRQNQSGGRKPSKQFRAIFL